MPQRNPDNYGWKRFMTGEDATGFIEGHALAKEIEKLQETIFYNVSMAESPGIFLIGEGCRSMRSTDFNLIVLEYSYAKEAIRSKLEGLDLPLIDKEKIIYLDDVKFLRDFKKDTPETCAIYRERSIPIWSDITRGKVLIESSLNYGTYDKDLLGWQSFGRKSNLFLSNSSCKEIWEDKDFSPLFKMTTEAAASIEEARAKLANRIHCIEDYILQKGDFLHGRLCIPGYTIRICESTYPIFQVTPRGINVNQNKRRVEIAYLVQPI